MAVEVVNGTAAFSFPTVRFTAPDGTFAVTMNGRLRLVPGAPGNPSPRMYSLGADRAVTFTPANRPARDQAQPHLEGKWSGIGGRLPGPDDVVAFEMPPLKVAGAPAVPDTVLDSTPTASGSRRQLGEVPVHERAILPALLAAWSGVWIPAPQQAPVFRAATDTVAVYVTVRDSRGQLVPDLDQEHFQVSEDGRPVPIAVFSRDPQPLSVAVMLDMSQGASWGGTNLRAAVLSFFDALRPVDRMSLGSFGLEIAVGANLTRDRVRDRPRARRGDVARRRHAVVGSHPRSDDVGVQRNRSACRVGCDGRPRLRRIARVRGWPIGHRTPAHRTGRHGVRGALREQP